MESTQIDQRTVSPFAAGLNWSANLHTGDERMDSTHEEFVTMLNALLKTPPTEQLNLYREFLNHTVEHFAQEDRWMVATGFSEDNCHAGQHATILETMRAVETHYVQATQKSFLAWLKPWPNGFLSTLPPWTPDWHSI